VLKKILKDDFVKNNIVFFIGSIAVAVLNYIFHPIMSRMMSVEDFGEVQALISMTYIVGILGVIFGTIAVNIVSNRDNSSDKHIKILSQLYKLALYIIGTFAVGIVVLSPYLKSILQFESALSFLPLALGMLVGIPFIFYGAYLKGVKDFKAMSLTGIIASSGKVVFAMILVFFGLRVFGAVSAFALATLSALFYTLYKTRGEFRLSLKEKFVFSAEMKKEFSYGLLIFFSLGFVTFLYTSDVIFVKHYFSPETAGLYSGIATIARIIFFATASVAGVILPTIKIKASYEENSAVMKKALVIITLMGIGALSVFFFLPSLIVSLLIGEKYLPLVDLLPLAGLYIFLASVVNLFYAYFLALRDRRLIIISSLGFVVIWVLMILNHETLKAVVVNYIIGTVVTMILIGGSILGKSVRK
jgi:O-antigen/teichoic acid export membrane protein